MKSIERRALEWSLGRSTGISSETLCRFMLGISNKDDWDGVPSDKSDRGRCIRLLKLIPEWIPRLDELANSKIGEPSSVNGETSGELFDSCTWRYQIDLIKKEGNL